MQIITGSTNFDNVTSNADASKHLGMIGADAVALNIGRKLEAEVGQTNNEVRIYDGEGFAQGIHFRVAPGTYDSVVVENGESGVKRTDLIVCRYQIDDNGYESTTWKTIKGPAGGAVPDYTHGSVRDESGDVIDVPFYRIEIEGLSITKVTPLFSVLVTWADMQEKMNRSRIFVGSKVVDLGDAKVTTRKVLSFNDVRKITGLDLTDTQCQTIVFIEFINGHYEANNPPCIATEIRADSKGYYARLQTATHHQYRFNYIIAVNI